MGRPSHTRALSVWTNGLRVGTWRIPTNGNMEFQYDADWIDSDEGRPLSLSLPFGFDTSPLRGEQVRNFFDNLLPDNEAIRRRLGTRFRTRSLDAFDLLEAVGRDCVGALQILAPDAEPDGFDRIEGRPLREDDVEDLLTRVVMPGTAAEQDDPDDLRLSLAGAQEKTALLYHDGQWWVPHGATPSTHILKLPLGFVGHAKIDMTTSVENEWLCLQLLEAFGLPAAAAEILQFGAQKVLSVTRFDRRMNPAAPWLLRLPQEDFCQALGVAPHLKYESDGGPGMVDICEILRQSAQQEADLRTFLSAQILFWMLAAPDGHAKNFSLRLLRRGRFELTPLYDVMSIWPVEGSTGSQWSWHKAKLAMAVPGRHERYRLKEIRRQHFNEMARLCFFGQDAEPILESLIERTPAAIEQVSARLPEHFPERVAQRIFAGLQHSADRLAEMSR
jgi:serine/threonine-protein kinase HipA